MTLTCTRQQKLPCVFLTNYFYSRVNFFFRPNDHGKIVKKKKMNDHSALAVAVQINTYSLLIIIQ